jgi:polysaccharide biosynthesis transport protein
MNIDNRDIKIEESLRGVPALPQPGDLSASFVRPSVVAGLDGAAGAIVLSSAPTPLALLMALRRRYKLAVGAGLTLAAIVAAGVWYFFPPSKYTARALLLVSSSNPKVIFKTQENLVEFQVYQKTQLTVVKNRTVLNAALNDPKVSKLSSVRDQVDPVLWLEKQIQADFQGEVFRISMSGEKPEDLAILVNAVKDAYMKNVVDQEFKDRFARRDELQKIYDEYEKKLEQKRGELKKLTQKVGSKDKQTIQYAQQLSLESLQTVRREMIQIQSELRRVKAELEIRLAQEKSGPVSPPLAESTIQHFINDDAEVKKQNGEIARLNRKKADADRVARSPTDPSRVAAAKSLANAQKELDKRVMAIRSQVLEKVGGIGPDGEDLEVRGLRDRIRVLEELGKVTQAIFDAQSAENQEISQDTIYIDTIEDAILHADSAARRIGEELEVLNVELRARSRIQPLESADAPRKEEDKRVSMAGMAGFGTFGIFVLGVAFLEFRTRRISSIDEVTQGLGLRVMGSLPPIRNPGRRTARIGGGSDPYRGNVLTESIDSIRTMILHSTGERSLRTIMVTSASSGEGKTSLACHLATSLARAGMKTLLIDCDLRKPTIHRLYDLPPTPGFSEFLRGEATADQVLRTTTADGPNLITAGACDHSALRALAQAPTGTIFDVFARSHDIIVLDTSPVLPVTDTLLVGRHVDAVVYSVLRDVSRLPWTLAALGRLRSLNIRILGAVVTGVPSQLYGSAYYNNYSSTVANHG